MACIINNVDMMSVGIIKIDAIVFIVLEMVVLVSGSAFAPVISLVGYSIIRAVHRNDNNAYSMLVILVNFVSGCLAVFAMNVNPYICVVSVYRNCRL